MDLLIPEAHAPGTTADGHAPGSTSGTCGRCGRCSTASTSCATSRRWSAPGSRWPTCRRTPRTTTSAPPSCSPRCTRPGCDRVVAASSMVVYGEGRYVCEEHGDQAPPPRERRGPGRAATSRTTARVCGRPLAWALVDEDARLDPRSSYAASKVATEHYPPRGRGRRARRGRRAALPQRLRAADAPRHALLRGRRDVPLLARAGQSRRTSSRTAARCATSCTSHDVARANVLALGRRWSTAPDETFTTYNVVLRGARLDPSGGRARRPACGERGRDLAPEVSGRYRLGDVRHIVASAERARDRLGFTARDPARAGAPASSPPRRCA